MQQPVARLAAWHLRRRTNETQRAARNGGCRTAGRSILDDDLGPSREAFLQISTGHFPLYSGFAMYAGVKTFRIFVEAVSTRMWPFIGSGTPFHLALVIG